MGRPRQQAQLGHRRSHETDAGRLNVQPNLLAARPVGPGQPCASGWLPQVLLHVCLTGGLPVKETLHIVHVLLQTAKGFLLGDTAPRKDWRGETMSSRSATRLGRGGGCTASCALSSRTALASCQRRSTTALGALEVPLAKLGAEQLQHHLGLHRMIPTQHCGCNADGVRSFSHSCDAESENLAKHLVMYWRSIPTLSSPIWRSW